MVRGHAGGAFRWIAPIAWALLGIVLLSYLSDWRLGVFLLFPGLPLLATSEHLRVKQAQVDVLVHRVQATLVPRRPNKPLPSGKP